MNKQQLRTIYKQKRAAISAQEKLKWDDLLLIQFQRFFFEDARVLLSYWPIDAMNEPNTFLFSGYVRHTVPGIEIAYTVANFDTYTMQPFIVNEGTMYVQNKYGIREPQMATPTDADLIDVVFVPLLVCDRQGYRVGYGKGFYDRFLLQCREDVIKIGFSYFDPVENIDDINKHDIPLNYCITTTALYEF